jgi:[acyl-carrier-protein] S-malonyltransferase
MQAFVFPGQGAQALGMGRDLAEAYPAARAVFEEVDAALGEKLSATIWEGPADALTLTANAQPALMATSLAAFRALEAEGLAAPDFVAGHSLGEYSALCAAGSLTVPDAARLLRLRGEAMQAAVPVGEGAMAAILGLDLAAVEAIAAEAAAGGAGSAETGSAETGSGETGSGETGSGETGSGESGAGGVCEAANDNDPAQVVVSGHRGAVERAVALAREKGAKRALLLPVSAPFHCALMRPAAAAMEQALGDVDLAAPSVPLVANVTARPVTDPAEIRRLLVRQVTARVRWRESVEWMAAQGVRRFVEVGAGKALSGMIRRIARDAETRAAGTAADIAAARG